MTPSNFCFLAARAGEPLLAAYRALGKPESIAAPSFVSLATFIEGVHEPVGAALGRGIVGVVIIGRPVARMRDDGMTAEVTRLCSDGTKDAPSFLYGASARAAFALGFKRIGTYILASEPGTSLTASGWRLLGQAGGGSWSRKDRPRVDKAPTQGKLLWEAVNG